MRTFPLIPHHSGETPRRISHTRFATMLALVGTVCWQAGCAVDPAKQTNQVAGCLDDGAVRAMAAAYKAREAADNPSPAMSADAAACTRDKYLQATADVSGKTVGYKAGLTNPAVQKRFNTDRPVWGVLGEAMLLTSPAKVSAQFGARPVFEADLLVRVKDVQINSASSPEEVLAHVDQIVPFMELPDLVVKNPSELSGNALGAINVGARLGVVGQPMAVPAGKSAQAALAKQLANMRVQLQDESGQQLAEGKGSDVLGNPLNAVVWLSQALKAEGKMLMPGQYVSVGSFSPLLPPKAGMRVQVRYQGVPGLSDAAVVFE